MPEVEIPHGEGGKDEKPVGITIAIVAVVMAIFGSLGNNAANERIVSEVRASNGYAWYQAKRQREYLGDLEIQRLKIGLAGNPTPAQSEAMRREMEELTVKRAKYETENQKILADARRSASEAKLHAARNDGFDHAELSLQVAVVLCSLTLLTRSKLFIRGGLVVAAFGLVLGGITLTKSIEDAVTEATDETPAAISEPAK